MSTGLRINNGEQGKGMLGILKFVKGRVVQRKEDTEAKKGDE